MANPARGLTAAIWARATGSETLKFCLLTAFPLASLCLGVRPFPPCFRVSASNPNPACAARGKPDVSSA